MRIFIGSLMWAALAGMTFGCTSHRHGQSGHQSESQSSRSDRHSETAAQSRIQGDDKAEENHAPASTDCVMQSAEHDVLKLMVSMDTKCGPKDGVLALILHEQHLEFWMVPGAMTVADAVHRVPEVIKDEFKDFKADSTADLTIARAPAKRILGSGTEADDGDPGHADVIVFKAGDRVFVACVHGEHLDAADREWLLKMARIAEGL